MSVYERVLAGNGISAANYNYPFLDLGSVTMEQCLSSIRLCYDQTSCSSCVDVGGCLWCASLNRCVESSIYPYLYPYGQCLGWQSVRGSDGARENTCSGEFMLSRGPVYFMCSVCVFVCVVCVCVFV